MTRKLLIFFVLLTALVSCTSGQKKAVEEPKDFMAYGPAEYLWERWTYPNVSFDEQKYDAVMQDVAQRFANSRSSEASWRVEGPLNIGGRVNCIAINPNNEDEIIIGTSAGGIFKTTDAAESWESSGEVFASMSIGSVAYDPQNTDVIYVGTGDPNISSTPKTGSGVYKSADGGLSWELLGLAEVGIISKILVHPTNSDMLYVASMGTPYYEDENRGVYRSVDGGLSWEKVLFLSPQAGVSALVFHPDFPDTLFAGGWNRIRNNQVSVTSGPEGRVYRSTDGGDSWEELSNGLPGGNLVRAALDVSLSEPGVVYASFVDPTSYEIEGVYRSDDFGDSWIEKNSSGLQDTQGGFGWYFGRIVVNPTNADQVSVAGVELHTSNNGGNSWFQSTPDWYTYEVHADMHDLVYSPTGKLWLATDGGLYTGSSNFNNWQYKSYLPISQFYRIDVNPHVPGVYAGGMQDNGTASGSYQNPADWPRLLGGDGFQCLYDWSNPSVFYAMTQNGSIYVQNGFGFDDFTSGIGGERVGWDAPLMMSSHNSQVLYTGTTKVYRASNGPNSFWQSVSDELTGPPNYYPANRHVISALAESPVNADVLYAGTSDGRVWVSQNAGGNWTNITEGLPDRYVTDIAASDAVEGRVFVVHSGYRDGDNTPLIHASDNFGADWYSVAGNMPEIGVNSIETLHETSDMVLFAGTDAGVFYTEDGGESWGKAGDMPNLLIFDLAIDYVNNRLVAGTFARSIQSISIDTLLTGTVGIQQPALQSLKIYPSPASTAIRIAEGKADAQWEIISLNGQLVKRGSGLDRPINIQDLPEGTYLLRSDDNFMGRFVKAKAQ